MAEIDRLFQLSPDHGIDNQFRLRYGLNFERRLNPCEPIEDGDLHLGVVDNNHINPRRLMLLPKDRQIISVSIPETGETCKLTLPGKSVIICFTESCEPEVEKIVTDDLSGNPDRRDHLHTTTVQKVKAAGWIPYWAPLQLETKIRHVRLVAERTVRSGEDPTEDDARKLAETFTRIG